MDKFDPKKFYKFVRYDTGAQMYGMGKTRFQEIAKEAYIKVKSLEKLKEKQKEQYDKEVLAQEFKLIDDIVNSKRTIA